MGGRATRVRLDGPVQDVAPTLLGAVLRAGGVAVRLTEVEAYAGESDPGSHAFRGRTPRTEVMFGPPAHAYIYFTYGMHWCINVVTGPDGTASAVLLRAGEVVDGLDLARERRPGVRDRELCRGPARLTKTLAIDGSYGGVDLLDPSSPVTLTAGRTSATVRTGPRVGVGGAGAGTPWRFWLEGEPTVSVYRPAVPRRRP
ncbi:MAG: DNA-3-methyladenine glycosylase [Actinobacteria bacterium]|nr:DNA-3-methyladenine glycosylase [Actinomycetota bacterium]MCA1721558.1 DNA-3-methyladenine glycosylase [Actinomycetota bacterium]